MTRAVVTGGAGFIGSHVAERLLREGWDVRIIDDLSTGLKSNVEEVKQSTGKALEGFFGDINADGATELILSFKPDFIFHLAAQANVRRSVAEPIFDATTNILGTIRLLEAARQVGVKGFIFSSTGGAVYGEQETFPADETHRTAPECPYGASKRAGELYLEYYARTFNFSGVALRYANVYGPRQNPKGEAGVVAVFTDRLLKGQDLTVNGDGEQTRDFVHVFDVVAANYGAAKALLEQKLKLQANYSVFNVGTSGETSVNDIVSALKVAWRETGTAKGERSEFIVKNGPALPGEQRRSVVDTTKIRRELGWAPQVKFADGLLATIESFRRTK